MLSIQVYVKTMAAFEIKDVYKYYGETHALDGVSLTAEEGKIFGLLGPNGAGKTTIVRMLSTLLSPDKGTAKVLGLDVTMENLYKHTYTNAFT